MQGSYQEIPGASKAEFALVFVAPSFMICPVPLCQIGVKFIDIPQTAIILKANKVL